VSYKANIQNDKTFSTADEISDLTNIITEIENNYTVSGLVETVGKTINGSIIIKYGNDLFQKRTNEIVVKRYTNVEKVYILGDKIVIKFTTDNKLLLLSVSEDFTTNKSIFVKDNYFNSDHIYKYLKWTEREIENVYANVNSLYITFKETE
jgi:hypothetical protein